MNQKIKSDAWPAHSKFVVAALLLLICVQAIASDATSAKAGAAKTEKQNKAKALIDEETGLRALNEQKTVLVDTDGKRVLVRAKVCLREGTLEMLMCPAETKEHESIIACNAKAMTIHAGLLSIGARTGTPVQFRPKYCPPTGQPIDIFIQWTDKTGKLHRVPAKEWVRYAIHRYFAHKIDKVPDGITFPRDDELRFDRFRNELLWYGPMTAKQRDELLALSDDKKYQEAIRQFFKLSQPRMMNARWIFTGSGFHVDENTGKRNYLADGGDLICVANFASAMIDIDVQSSAAGDSLTFEAWTDRIPPEDTQVTVELIPVFEAGTRSAKSAAKKPGDRQSAP